MISGPPADDEVTLLHSRYPSVRKDLLQCMGKAAGGLRRALANEELTTVITTRWLLAMCARLERSNEFARALQVCVLNTVPQEDVRVIRETFEHHVGPLGQAKAKPSPNASADKRATFASRLPG